MLLEATHKDAQKETAQQKIAVFVQFGTEANGCCSAAWPGSLSYRPKFENLDRNA